MNLSGTDIGIFVGSLLLIVIITLTFPSMGLVDDSFDGANETNIPKADFADSRFEFLGDMPIKPTTPSGGEFMYESEREGSVDSPERDREFLKRSVTDDQQIQVFFIPESGVGTNSAPMNASIREFDSDGNFIARDDQTMSEVGDDATVSMGDYEVYMQWTEIEDNATSDMQARAEWEVLAGPQDAAWYSGLPVIGGLIASGAETAAVGQWFISIIFWGVLWFVELVINAIVILVSAFIYLFDLLAFITTVQISLVGHAPGFVSVLLIVVNVAFFVELAKVIMLLIKVLPTT